MSTSIKAASQLDGLRQEWKAREVLGATTEFRAAVDTSQLGLRDAVRSRAHPLQLIKSLALPCQKMFSLPDYARMLDEKLLAEINGPYVCPREAGPAWRAACDYGFDMSLVEDALRKTPEERLEEHQRALNLVLEIMAARELTLQHGSGR